jgi:hypothetical protein
MSRLLLEASCQCDDENRKYRFNFTDTLALRFRGPHASRLGRKRTANQQHGVCENPETETPSRLERVMPEKIANATTTRRLLTIGFSDNRKTDCFHRENRMSATARPFPDARKRGSPSDTLRN